MADSKPVAKTCETACGTCKDCLPNVLDAVHLALPPPMQKKYSRLLRALTTFNNASAFFFDIFHFLPDSSYTLDVFKEAEEVLAAIMVGPPKLWGGRASTSARQALARLLKATPGPLRKALPRSGFKLLLSYLTMTRHPWCSLEGSAMFKDACFIDNPYNHTTEDLRAASLASTMSTLAGLVPKMPRGQPLSPFASLGQDQGTWLVCSVPTCLLQCLGPGGCGLDPSELLATAGLVSIKVAGAYGSNGKCLLLPWAGRASAEKMPGYQLIELNDAQAIAWASTKGGSRNTTSNSNSSGGSTGGGSGSSAGGAKSDRVDDADAAAAGPAATSAEPSSGALLVPAIKVPASLTLLLNREKHAAYMTMGCTTLATRYTTELAAAPPEPAAGSQPPPHKRGPGSSAVVRAAVAASYGLSPSFSVSPVQPLPMEESAEVAPVDAAEGASEPAVVVPSTPSPPMDAATAVGITLAAAAAASSVALAFGDASSLCDTPAYVNTLVDALLALAADQPHVFEGCPGMTSGVAAEVSGAVLEEAEAEGAETSAEGMVEGEVREVEGSPFVRASSAT